MTVPQSHVCLFWCRARTFVLPLDPPQHQIVLLWWKVAICEMSDCCGSKHTHPFGRQRNIEFTNQNYTLPVILNELCKHSTSQRIIDSMSRSPVLWYLLFLWDKKMIHGSLLYTLMNQYSFWRWTNLILIFLQCSQKYKVYGWRTETFTYGMGRIEVWNTLLFHVLFAIWR